MPELLALVVLDALHTRLWWRCVSSLSSFVIFSSTQLWSHQRLMLLGARRRVLITEDTRNATERYFSASSSDKTKASCAEVETRPCNGTRLELHRLPHFFIFRCERPTFTGDDTAQPWQPPLITLMVALCCATFAIVIFHVYLRYASMSSSLLLSLKNEQENGSSRSPHYRPWR